MKKNTEADFWRQIDKAGPVPVHCPELGPCWPWTSGPPGDQYGNFKLEGVNGAHRVAWVLANGPIPVGLCVCHKCDFRRCCNPRHLFAATKDGNNKDCAAKGRHAAHLHPEMQRGERNGHARLTLAQVRAIRERYAAGGISQQQLGQEYGVGQSAIHKVTAGIAWTGGRQGRPIRQITGIHGNAGEGNSAAKVTMTTARQIRAQYAAGRVSQSQLAREYGVCPTSIFNIIHGETWLECYG